MENWVFDSYEAPRIEDGSALLLGGYRAAFTPDEMEKIPALWMRFGPNFGHLPNQVGGIGYGLGIGVRHGSNNFEYMAAMEIRSADGLAEGMTSYRVPAQQYAVFNHPHHVSELGKMINTIVQKYFPDSPYESNFAGGVDFFERYSEEFDPLVGVGGMEIWFPIKPKAS